MSRAMSRLAAWLGARKILGSLLTAVATLPIGSGLGVVATFGVALCACVATGFKR